MASEKAGFDPQTYEMIRKLYGRMIINLDLLPIKSLNFNTRFELMKKELLPSIINDDFKDVIHDMRTLLKYSPREFNLLIHIILIIMP